MHSSSRSRPRHGGFTLVEMLVVVAIITILAAILVPAVYMGLSAASDARIAIEISNLDAAMRQYKTVTHGHYPPNFTTAAQANAHIQQKFGRYNPTTATVTPPPGLDPAEALVFWLQGYGSNPEDPLVGRKELFDFDESRLIDNGDGDQYLVYYPRGGQNIPYVYFHSASYATIKYGDGANELRVGTGVAHPYMRDGGTEFANADSFQMHSAGQDGDWGADSTTKQFPAGVNYNEADGDNMTNFSEGTLADQIP